MAKGRRSKKSKKGLGATNDEAPESKVSAEPVWDLVYVIPKEERAKTLCQRDGCAKQAVTKWATMPGEAETWHCCEQCQEDEFNGWPEGVDCPSDLDEDEDEDDNDATAPSPEDTVTDKHDSTTANVVVSEESSAESPSSAPSESPSMTQDADANDEGGELVPVIDTPMASAVVTTPAADESPCLEEVPMDSEVTMTCDNDKVTKTPMNADMQDGVEEDSDGEEEDDAWDLIEVLSEDVITQVPVPCDGCTLKACVVFRGNKTKKPWSGCLDCQESEFGGWPEEAKEIPVKHLSTSHKAVMTKHCSTQEDPVFPDFDALYGPGEDSSGSSSESPSKDAKTSVPEKPCTLTPPPSSATKKSQGKLTTVTPSPFAQVLDKKKKKTEQEQASAAGKMSKATIEARKKWQSEAEKMGGPDAKIICDKPVAKEKIFNMMKDEFRPMNINDINIKMKATIPAPILKSCLEDMAALNEPFEMSDDDDDEPPKAKKQKESSEPFFGHLKHKAGKNPSLSIYYVDQTKLDHCGDPDLEKINELAAKQSTADSEVAFLNLQIKALLAESTKLESEPTNVEATQILSKEEPKGDVLRATVEDARGLKANEKQRKATKKTIDKMTGEWRKRKNLCLSFLVMLGENLDSFSLSKTLKGDGAIYCEGDEMIIKQATEVANMQKKKPLLKRRKLNAPTKAASNKGLADPNFIGCLLGSSGVAERIYLDK